MPSYKSRRRNSRYSKSKARNSRVGGSVATLLNPFSNAQVNPKVPDGKVAMSTGIRQQSNTSHTLDAAVDVILIIPGKTGGIRFYPAVAAPADTVALDLATPTVESYASTLSDISKYRIVSHGCRLMCTSNATTNDGWWEACRVSALDGTIALNKFVDHPSYTTGKIRDLNNYLFQLKPTEEYEFVNATTLIHPSMDIIAIKLHGSAGINIVCHCVSNQEVIFDENSTLARFMTTSIRSPAFNSIFASLTRNLKAAQRMFYG